MYADSITDSMARAIDETNRRREKQEAYNTAHGVDPQPLRKRIADITDLLAREDADTEELLGGSGRSRSRGKAAGADMRSRVKAGGAGGATGSARVGAGAGTDTSRALVDDTGMPARDLAELIQRLTAQMHAAAAELQFELAARYRDEISELKKELRQMREAGLL